MKLLVVGPDMRDLRRVKNFTGVQAFYLMREFRNRGVEMVFANPKHPNMIDYLTHLDGQGCDHVLALGLRWFTHQPKGCATILKTKTNGAVTMLHDGLVHDYLDEFMVGVDCTFMFRNDKLRTKEWNRRYAKNYCYIGWAADPEFLYPDQKADELRILIDHPYYKSGTPDITTAVVNDTVLFAQSGSWREKFKTIRVRRLVNGGAEDVNFDKPDVRPFDRQHVPFGDIVREYRKSLVYCVTHKESVGLTCLELAYCGAMVVAPKGMIYQDRLDTMRHVQYEGVRAPWPNILDAINIKELAEMARKQTWGDVAERMLQWFKDYK